MAIRGVTFDWWGTIARIPPRVEDAAMKELRISRLVESLHGTGVTFDHGVLHKAYDRQGELLEEAWANQQEMAPEEQIQAFLGFAGIREDPESYASVAEAFGGAILIRPPTLFPGIRESLRQLKDGGLAVGLISNTGRSWGRYLTMLQGALGIRDCFDVRVYSDELRVRKPDPRMFEAALSGLGLKPGEVVHIGDDVTADIAAAKAVGMHAVWFNTGFWEGSTTDQADREIRGHTELPPILEHWR